MFVYERFVPQRSFIIHPQGDIMMCISLKFHILNQDGLVYPLNFDIYV